MQRNTDTQESAIMIRVLHSELNNLHRNAARGTYEARIRMTYQIDDHPAQFSADVFTSVGLPGGVTAQGVQDALLTRAVTPVHNGVAGEPASPVNIFRELRCREMGRTAGSFRARRAVARIKGLFGNVGGAGMAAC